MFSTNTYRFLNENSGLGGLFLFILEHERMIDKRKVFDILNKLKGWGTIINSHWPSSKEVPTLFPF